MKVLMPIYQIQDYGGIINHVENLTAGFKQIGVEVDIVQMCPKHRVINVASKKNDWQRRPEGTGYLFNQARGWSGIPKVPYLDPKARNKFREDSLQYDAVLWHIPVPTKNKDNKDVSVWRELYHPHANHYGVIHDGNFPHLYPHLHYLRWCFNGLICVHEAAYHSTVNTGINVPTTMIVNPFDLTEWQKDPEAYAPMKWQYRSGFASVQVFKAWKHVDQLIRAIPHMRNNEKKLVGGAGIEYRYMTSYDKCKDKYKDELGNRIWDNAIQYDMKYLGVIPNADFYNHLKQAKLQIDPSWSKRYSQSGAHFNRTTIEAMVCGAVPVATDLGMNNSQVLQAGKNYFEIEHYADSKHFAYLIDYWLSHYSRAQWHDIRINNWENIVPEFDMVKVAYQYLAFFSHKLPTSSLVRIKHLSPQDKTKAEQKLRTKSMKNLEFFGITDEYF